MIIIIVSHDRQYDINRRPSPNCHPFLYDRWVEIRTCLPRLKKWICIAILVEAINWHVFQIAGNEGNGVIQRSLNRRFPPASGRMNAIIKKNQLLLHFLSLPLGQFFHPLVQKLRRSVHYEIPLFLRRALGNSDISKIVFRKSSCSCLKWSAKSPPGFVIGGGYVLLFSVHCLNISNL